MFKYMSSSTLIPKTLVTQGLAHCWRAVWVNTCFQNQMYKVFWLPGMLDYLCRWFIFVRADRRSLHLKGITWKVILFFWYCFSLGFKHAFFFYYTSLWWRNSYICQIIAGFSVLFLNLNSYTYFRSVLWNFLK